MAKVLESETRAQAVDSALSQLQTDNGVLRRQLEQRALECQQLKEKVTQLTARVKALTQDLPQLTFQLGTKIGETIGTVVITAVSRQIEGKFS